MAGTGKPDRPDSRNDGDSRNSTQHGTGNLLSQPAPVENPTPLKIQGILVYINSRRSVYTHIQHIRYRSVNGEIQ